MKNQPEKIRLAVPQHVEYWQSKKLEQYEGGPFSDRSGGLITFAADDSDTTETTIMNDSFVKEDLIEKKWIKEWLVE